MTTVILAEKPSQARDIAKVIGIKRSLPGAIELVNGWFVTNALGHLLELCEPKEYNEDWGKRWSWPQLPMIPPKWKRTVVKKTSAQFKIVKALLKSATRVIIATDAGREGELIAREILEECKFKGTIDRFWTSALTPADIEKALKNLRPGSETYPLFEAAEARSHSDWLMGLSGTRAATLAANVRGDYFPLGRVKTPTLAMIVRQSDAVKNFDAKEYFELEATVLSSKGVPFKMTHAPREEERIRTLEEANRRKEQANKAQGPISVFTTKEKTAPSLPYSLPVLQQDANRVLGFSAKNTLKVAQSLYDKKATSYPRTDCRFLSENQVPEIPGVLDVVAKRFPREVAALNSMGVTARATTFDSSKLVDHHGIVPTGLFVAELDGAELQLYSLICRRYLETLGPDHHYDATKVSMDANGVVFTTSGRVVTSPGWRAIWSASSDSSAAEEEA